MSKESQTYDRWMENVSSSDRSLLEEQVDSIDALKDAFYRELAFGTAGLRGIIGMGPNRMNVYTVGKATQGLADYLNAHCESPSVAIARDSRNMGREFVRTAASVLAANGITAHVYEEIQPTPVLSFTVRDLGCSAGINVTASHNPSEYNGYKVYGDDGCQITSEAAKEIQENIDSTDCFDDVKTMDFDEAVASGKVKWIGQSVVERFLDQVHGQSLMPSNASRDPLKIVYTPLNGTGLHCVTSIIQRCGFTELEVVDEQKDPDGDFTTCPYPNPEDKEALKVGLALCEKTEPDILLATDPDADRVGIAVLHDGEYVLLTGNEVGVLLIEYLCRAREGSGCDLSDKLVITTIVSSLMPDAQARAHGFELRRVLTGFKYIGEQISALEEGSKDFMFGFEESYGYMAGTYVRDKDAITASMLICEMAQMHKDDGSDLVDAMESLYEKYGYYLNRTVSFSYPGSAGAARMEEIMGSLRTNPPQKIASMEVASILDYEEDVPMSKINGRSDEEEKLPRANVICFELREGTRMIIRPSGTEPKVKAYLFSNEPTREQAIRLLDELETAARELLE